MKTKRHNKILEIVENSVIETQEELISRLRQSGFDVTQATVSRDMRELKLAKVMTDKGTYKYTTPAQSEADSSHVYNRALIGSIKYIDGAGNNIVIKTYPGMANAVALGIESLDEPEILGCVAGDDSIIIVVRDNQAVIDICAKIKSLISS